MTNQIIDVALNQRFFLKKKKLNFQCKLFEGSLAGLCPASQQL